MTFPGRRRRVWGVLLAVLVLSVSMSLASAARTTSGCTASTLAVVAHPDDDLFFLNPDMAQDVTAGKCVTVVFVTAGDAGQGASYAASRAAGSEAAYGVMAASDASWDVTEQTVDDKSVQVRTLPTRPGLTLMFLQLPDGNMDGSGFGANDHSSLEKLLGGDAPSLTTIASPTTTYSRSELVSTIASVMTDVHPDVIRTSDFGASSSSVDDHSDHLAVGQLVVEAREQAGLDVTLLGYVGYPVLELDANVASAEFAAKSAAYDAYAPHDPQVCSTTDACISSGRPEGGWLTRQHIGSRVSGPPRSEPVPGAINVAPTATVAASSEDTATGQTADKAIDGAADGYPGDHTREWASRAQGVGAHLTLTWGTAQRLSAISLSDRPNSDDRITAGALTFSDGSTVPVPALPNDGSLTTIEFPARSTTSVRFTVSATSTSTRNIGLAELQAWRTESPTPSPSTGSGHNVARVGEVTASTENEATEQTARKAVDGVADGYPGAHTAEWATTGERAGSWLLLTWTTSQELSRVVLVDRPNEDDHVTAGTLTFSDGSSVPVPELANDGTPTIVEFTPRATTSVHLTITSVSGSTINSGLAELEAWTS